jgi:hypothetical protein
MTVFAAADAGIAALHPGYAAGTWIGSRIVAPTAITNYVANTLYAAPFVVFSPVRLDRLSINCTTGVASCLGLIGIYGHDAAARAPGALLGTTGNIDLSTAAMKEADLTAPVLAPPGIIWFAALFNGLAQCTGFSTNNAQSEPINELIGYPNSSGIATSTAANRQGRIQRASVTFASGLPAAFGAATRSSASPTTPVIMARVAA